ncbi:hypothetical protein [Microvirga sp. 2TAF3]|uniref:hypothetical protein n=1 Tax=Microvirga sp. 2TAF3 TaxID=3233014 RepID=UPI003F9CF836
MNFGRWVFGAVVGAFGLGAVGVQAAPLPVVTADAPASLQQVQFYYYDEPPVYYDPPPPRYYAPPPRYHRPPPPPTAYYPPPRRGYYYDKEAAKDYVKDYRRAQKEVTKEQIRSWNQRNGF